MRKRKLLNLEGVEIDAKLTIVAANSTYSGITPHVEKMKLDANTHLHAFLGRTSTPCAFELTKAGIKHANKVARTLAREVSFPVTHLWRISVKLPAEVKRALIARAEIVRNDRLDEYRANLVQQIRNYEKALKEHDSSVVSERKRIKQSVRASMLAADTETTITIIA